MNKINKIKLFLPITTLTLLGTFFINVQKANAGVFGFLGDMSTDILNGIFSLLLVVVKTFTGFAGKSFTAILEFGFQDMEPILVGWQICRDIVNMFFILGLVIIAFATILRFEGYGIKRLLPKLIIMALLINFSFIISAVIVDISQIVTYHFLGQIQTNDYGAAIIDVIGVTESLKAEGSTGVNISGQDPDMINLLSAAFTVAIVFVTGFVLLIGTALLILRIGALWALMILSPFAWFFSIFPGLQQHSRRWWSYKH